MALNNSLYMGMGGGVPNSEYAKVDNKVTFARTVVMFTRYGGLPLKRHFDKLHVTHVMEDITTEANVTGAAVDETEVKTAGFQPTKVDFGQINTYEFTTLGHNWSGFAAIFGNDTSNVADDDYGVLRRSTGVNIDGDKGVLGSLIFLYLDTAGRIMGSSIITQGRFIVRDSLGTAKDSKVMFESGANGESFKVEFGSQIVSEVFRTDPLNNINNGFSPDGIVLGFKLGNGNQSLEFATLPIGEGLPIVPINRYNAPLGIAEQDIQDPYFWFAEVVLDGRIVMRDELDYFDRATGMLYFKTPPPLESTLTISYALATGAPIFENKRKYVQYDRVKYNELTYECSNPLGTGAGAFVTGDWTLIPTSTSHVGSEWRPHVQGRSYYKNTLYPTNMFHTWSEINGL